MDSAAYLLHDAVILLGGFRRLATLAFRQDIFQHVVITLIYGRVAVWIYDLFHKEDLFYGAPPLLDNDKTVFWSAAILMTVISLFNYLLTYLRFRESEIINRW